MKKIKLLIITLGFLLVGCSTIREVPVKEIVAKIEYRDKILIDSIYQRDSVFIYNKNDTVYMNKYIYKYRDRILSDTIHIFQTDSIQVPVEVIKEVNKTSKSQRVLIGIGISAIVILVTFVGIKIYKKIKKIK